MKYLIIFITTLFISVTTHSQESSSSKHIKEFGVTTTNFSTYDLSFKYGGKKNVFISAKTMNLILKKEISTNPDTSITIWKRGAGLSIGIEKRIYSTPNLFWSIGVDVFGHYTLEKDSVGQDKNFDKLSSFKNKQYLTGIAIPFSFNYLFAKSHLMGSFEFSPGYSKTSLIKENYNAGMLIQQDTEKYITTQWNFINSSTIRFSVAYRFFKD